MAKTLYEFNAKVVLNLQKGGGWLATWEKVNLDTTSKESDSLPWKNASAAKRWLKGEVARMTTRKSIKMIATAKKDEKDKPAEYVGSVTFRDTK